MKRNLSLVTLSVIVLFVSMASFTQRNNSNLVEDVLSQTNQYRKSKGMAELIIRNDLNAIAQKHSADMAAGRVGFGHSGLEKRNSMAKKTIRPMYSFAENVAYGASSGKEVVNLWKNSSGHRRNMLGRFRYIGIGVAKDKQGRKYYTQVFAG